MRTIRSTAADVLDTFLDDMDEVGHTEGKHKAACRLLMAPILATVVGGGASGATSAADGLVQVESFDCFKAGAGPGEIEGAAIGAWQGGGPAGASWNVTDLSCAARILSTCRDGAVDWEHRIGRALVARHTTALGPAGRAEWRFTVKRAQWAKNLDDEHAAKKALYRTAIFRLASTLSCRKPYELAPGVGPRSELTADRAFVAGFASGE